MLRTKPNPAHVKLQFSICTLCAFNLKFSLSHFPRALWVRIRPSQIGELALQAQRARIFIFDEIPVLVCRSGYCFHLIYLVLQKKFVHLRAGNIPQAECTKKEIGTPRGCPFFVLPTVQAHKFASLGYGISFFLLLSMRLYQADRTPK